MTTGATKFTLSVLQAQRAQSMADTVGEDYLQPAHAWHAEKLAKLGLEPDEVEALSRQVVLPGAKRAVHFGVIEEMKSRGLETHEMVAEINARADVGLVARRTQYQEWRDGPLTDHLERIRMRAARRAELLAQQRAAVEQQLDEELGEDASVKVERSGNATIVKRKKNR